METYTNRKILEGPKPKFGAIIETKWYLNQKIKCTKINPLTLKQLGMIVDNLYNYPL